MLSKSDFILKKRHKNYVKQKGNWLQKPSNLTRSDFHLNKHSLIQSLNQLSKSSNSKCSKNYSKESLSEASSSSFSDDALSSKSNSLDSLVIGPYLNKFERENLNNIKTNLLKNIATKNNAYSSLSKNYLNKFLNESASRTINNYEIFKSSKYLIPWEYIEPKSAALIIDLFNSNENAFDFNFFDMNGNTINPKQVLKWIEILKDIHYERIFKDNEIILPINDDETSPNRVRLHTNEEVFDEVTEDSFESTSSKSDYYYRYANNMVNNKPTMPMTNLKEADIIKKKSPEKQMLYHDWFDIVKKIHKDPNFDLETMIRTRGRFTDHQNINYRNVLKQKLRSKGKLIETNFTYTIWYIIALSVILCQNKIK